MSPPTIRNTYTLQKHNSGSQNIQVKEKKRKENVIQFIWCWLSTSGHGAYPQVWFIQLMGFHWRKLIFHLQKDVNYRQFLGILKNQVVSFLDVQILLSSLCIPDILIVCQIIPGKDFYFHILFLQLITGFLCSTDMCPEVLPTNC